MCKPKKAGLFSPQTKWTDEEPAPDHSLTVDDEHFIPALTDQAEGLLQLHL